MRIYFDAVDHLVELPEIYDGWSVAVLKDGTLRNRWDPEVHPYRYEKTQEYIEALKGVRTE